MKPVLIVISGALWRHALALQAKGLGNCLILQRKHGLQELDMVIV